MNDLHTAARAFLLATAGDPEVTINVKSQQKRADLVALADSLRAALLQYEKNEDAKQARIDALMLEFCPDEMTEEQLANWAAHQRAVKGGVRQALQPINKEGNER